MCCSDALWRCDVTSSSRSFQNFKTWHCQRTCITNMMTVFSFKFGGGNRNLYYFYWFELRFTIGWNRNKMKLRKAGVCFATSSRRTTSQVAGLTKNALWIITKTSWPKTKETHLHADCFPTTVWVGVSVGENIISLQSTSLLMYVCVSYLPFSRFTWLLKQILINFLKSIICAIFIHKAFRLSSFYVITKLS